MTKFRDNMAVLCGINAACVAEYLWERVCFNRYSEEYVTGDVYWHRVSVPTIMTDMNFLSKDQITRAIRVLIDKNIIRKDILNEDPFDKTCWYRFTEYGERNMIRGEA